MLSLLDALEVLPYKTTTPREMVDAATKAKKAWTASAAAPARDDDSNDE